jgi:FkbM family methyltransferase
MKYYSQFQQDKIIYENFFKDIKKGYFVDIGAYDGETQGSNSLLFEQLGWNGVCVEPNPKQFKKLISNRKCKCYDYAISDKVGEAEFLFIKNGPDTLGGLIDEFDPKELESFTNNELKNSSTKYERIVVKTELFDNIVTQKTINYLSLDTEGNEIKILHTIDFDKYDIEVLSIENNFKDDRFQKFFQDKPYILFQRTGCDEIYIKKSLIGRIQKKLIIANMYRAKNKSAFFAIHQALHKLSEFEIEFHILWDDPDYRDEWTKKIEDLNCNIISYTKDQLDQYCLNYGVTQEFVNKFVNFKAIYFIIHGHYLKKNNITDYYLIYDDDIILKDDITELKECLRNKIPCLIYEPLNAGCDKTMIHKLLSLYEESFEYYKSINPQLLGFNAGFQGISLDMYEDFLTPEYFKLLLELFDYRGIYDEKGDEITGPERSAIDTQQQSFFGIMNIIRSKTPPHILNPNEYFVCPNWGYHPTYGDIDPSNEYEGWDVNMKSKIIHFIGHTILNGVYYGKPKIYHQLMDEYLKEYNLL